MNIKKLSRQEKESLFRQKEIELGIIDDDDRFNLYTINGEDSNVENWSEEKLDAALKDNVAQVRFNKFWPMINFVIAMIIVFALMKLISVFF